MSRSAQSAAVPIVDNIIRAVPNVTRHARDLADASEADLQAIVSEFDADEALEAAERAIRGGTLE
jgi:4-phosphopantoate--beta-alanine ligase